MEPAAPYTALARRFRPQTFSEVVGQGRVATTLRNAIREGRVAHAYLFTGARGVGKTSMARIFAKALNCPQAVDAVPCNQCEICRGISTGQDVDVSEIDGASNRGIDDIRSLRANVNVRSMRSKYKIYIVDEVHMLTKEAFNALLKTLEEPPPGVKFIFCTTEPNKVPDTILSRCQRFDFGTIATDEIVGRLSQLAAAEGFDVEPDALELVARRAAGSMRDSQSLFDQLLAFGSDRITANDVHRLLGTAPDDRLIAIVQSLLDRNQSEALGLLDQALAEGVQLEPFWDQVIGYFRDLMVSAVGAAELPLVSVGRDHRDELTQQAASNGLQATVAALEILAETKLRMQRSTFGRVLAELALVRVSLLRDLDRLEDVIAALQTGTPIGDSGHAAPRPAAKLPPPSSPQKKSDGPLTNGRSAVEAPPAPLGYKSPPPAQADQSVAVATQAPPRDFAASDPPPVEALGVEEEVPQAPRIVWNSDCGPALLALLVDSFPDIVGTYLRQAVSTAIFGPNQLEISFRPSYDIGRRGCERPEVLARLEACATKAVGTPVRIRFRVLEGAAAPVEAKPTTPLPARHRTIEEPGDALVAEIGRVFGIELWRVQELGRLAVEAEVADEE